jgi:DNA modification methylase
LKSFDGATRSLLIEMFAKTPFRLCCTATPAPNDHAELANHAEFLGVMSRAEMLATFFVHDEQDWRLKGHAAEAFWRWLVSWAVCIRKPSDIGCEDDKFILPKLTWHRDVIHTDFRQEGMLFGSAVVGLQGRVAARRATIEKRAEFTVELIAKKLKEQWIIWCALNDEQDALEKLFADDCASVRGSDSHEEKERSVLDFLNGKVRVLITKPSILGYGLNLQCCRNVVFFGLSDSFEQLYQAIRRCWRFGQTEEVHAHVVTADAEGPVVENIKRKEEDFERMSIEMVKNMAALELDEVRGQHREKVEYERDVKQTAEWTYHLGDSCEVIQEIPDDSIDMSVCSPPFAALYTYTNTERDMGNCSSEATFFAHYDFLLKHWLRITKPGRIACIHVSQVPAMLSRDGYIGLKDFRGKVIEAHIAAGWIYHGEAAIDKNPQAQAIRTKAKGLTFSQLERDASWMRPALADFLLLFRKPGENQVIVKPDVTRDEWIEYARPCWHGISETDTLSVAEAREEKDERHVCPLQLGLIDRCVRLWSNKGETVFSPFGGIGSEGYQALLRRRKFIGVELKRSYWKTGCDNLMKAIERRSEGQLFSETEE